MVYNNADFDGLSAVIVNEDPELRLPKHGVGKKSMKDREWTVQSNHLGQQKIFLFLFSSLKKDNIKTAHKAPFHYPKPPIAFHSFATLVFAIGIKNSATGVKRCCSHLRLRCTSAQVFPASPLLHSQRPRIAFLTSGFHFAGLPARNHNRSINFEGRRMNKQS